MRFRLPWLPRPTAYAFKGRVLHRDLGDLPIGMDEKADPSNAKAMPAGSFIALAPSTPPVAVDEETVVQLNNVGPWVITYIDPKDDPRHKPK